MRRLDLDCHPLPAHITAGGSYGQQKLLTTRASTIGVRALRRLTWRLLTELQGTETAMKRALTIIAVALVFFAIGLGAGASLLLLNPSLPLSGITIDMRNGTFKFEIPKLLRWR
jgi:hypothetical protein